MEKQIESNIQDSQKSVQIVFYMCAQIQPFNKPAKTIKFKEEGEYIADKDFDWDNILQYCEAQRRFMEKLCYQTNILKNFSVQTFVNVIEPVDPKRITKHSSLRLIKTQAKNFYAKYGAYIDRRSALNFSDIYDYILTGAPKPERLIEQEKAGQNKDFGQNL